MTFRDILMQIWTEQSFASIWYWALWIYLIHDGLARVCGVPADVIAEAKRDPVWQRRAEALAEAQTARIRAVWESAGWFFAGVIAFVFALFWVIGWIYGAPMGQALSLLLIPFLLARWRGRRTARRGLEGPALLDALERTRRGNSVILTIGFTFALILALFHLQGQFLW
ncbi:hypothetical protein ACMA5I_11790 [Paracoccaceae bacterium GXU_MW_L88]